jgi:DNA-binding MarR family transcriptional regulator
MREDEIARNILGMYFPLVKCFQSSFSERSGLSIGQFRILALIEFESVRQVTKLAERNLVSQPSMSRTIDGLVQLGCIRRTESREDRRINELHLTSKGRQSMSVVYSKSVKEIVPRLMRLSPQKQKQLALAINVVTRMLSEEPSKTLRGNPRVDSTEPEKTSRRLM